MLSSRKHTSCMTEAEKYEKSLYKGPRTQVRYQFDLRILGNLMLADIFCRVLLNQTGKTTLPNRLRPHLPQQIPIALRRLRVGKLAITMATRTETANDNSSITGNNMDNSEVGRTTITTTIEGRHSTVVIHRTSSNW